MGLFPGHARRAIAVVLRGVMLRVFEEEIAMGGGGKTPARIVPYIFEFARAGQATVYREVNRAGIERYPAGARSLETAVGFASGELDA
jgi:hypothetical protein